MSCETISVLVPTRGRVARLERLIETFATTTTTAHGRRLAEVVFRCDDDDRATRDFLAVRDLPALVGPRLKGYLSLATFFNDLAGVAAGDLFVCGNDDMAFVTAGWDRALLDAARAFPDGIFALGVRTLNARVFPFATISRKARDAMGFLWDPRVQQGDLWWKHVCVTFGRAVMLDQVEIAHEWAGHDPDQTHREAQPSLLHLARPNYTAEHNAAIADAVARLRPWLLPSP